MPVPFGTAEDRIAEATGVTDGVRSGSGLVFCLAYRKTFWCSKRQDLTPRTPRCCMVRAVFGLPVDDCGLPAVVGRGSQRRSGVRSEQEIDPGPFSLTQVCHIDACPIGTAEDRSAEATGVTDGSDGVRVRRGQVLSFASLAFSCSAVRTSLCCSPPLAIKRPWPLWPC